MKIQKVIAIAAAVCGFGAAAADGAYAISNEGNGKSYIDITENLDEFSFSVGGYSSGMAGRIGYFTFEGKPSKKTVQAAAQQGGQLIGAGQTSVTLTDLSAGTHIGFYLTDAYGNLNTAFKFTGDPAIGDLAIEFKGNGHDPNGHGVGHSSHGEGYGFGHWESGWMKIASIGAGGGGVGGSVPTGRPLPGALASLLAGAVGVGLAARRKKREEGSLAINRTAASIQQPTTNAN